MKTINRMILSICVLLAMAGCHKDNMSDEETTPRIIWTQSRPNDIPHDVDIVAHYSDGGLLYFKLMNDTISEDELICVGNRFSFEDSPNGNYDLVIPETIIANPPCEDYYNYDYYLDMPKTFSVTRIGRAGEYNDLFDHRMTSLAIPNTIKLIGERCFIGCSSLNRIVFPAGLETIGERCFIGCSSLNRIVFPAGLETIGRGAFENCESLAEITLPGSIQKVEYGAFVGCSSLHSVTIQPGMSTIPERAFSGAFSNSEYEDASITLYLPEGLQVIEQDAFERCTSLAEISFPTTIRKVHFRAFYDCYSLRIVTIQSGIDTIPEAAFSGVFSNYSEMSEVSLILPEGLEVIGMNAFRDCNSLTVCTCYASIPPTMEYDYWWNDYHYPFDGTSLRSIYVPDESVEAYKNAAGWSEYADIIYPIE